ncbi:MAG: energy transducer TonB [Flavobacteriales bacterium]|nr:energy transducer TonB [Flavobacteriales bacterium]
MVSKNHPFYHLEKKRSSFLAIGMTLSLFFVLTAMEWTTTTIKIIERPPDIDAIDIDDIDIVITTQPIKKTPPPIQPPRPRPVPEPVLVLTEDLSPDPKPDPIPDSVLYGDPEPEVFASEPKFFIIVEEMPHFGDEKGDLQKYLNRKLKYVDPARSMGVSGTVYVRFIVNKKGEIVEAEVLKGPGYGLNKEALRVVRGMPKWHPGKQRGKGVPVRFTLPVRFKLG